MLILSMLFDLIGKLLTKIFRLNDYQEKNHQLSRTKAIIFLISKNLHRDVNMTFLHCRTYSNNLDLKSSAKLMVKFDVNDHR